MSDRLERVRLNIPVGAVMRILGELSVFDMRSGMTLDDSSDGGMEFSCVEKKRENRRTTHFVGKQTGNVLIPVFVSSVLVLCFPLLRVRPDPGNDKMEKHRGDGQASGNDGSCSRPRTTATTNAKETLYEPSRCDWMTLFE